MTVAKDDPALKTRSPMDFVDLRFLKTLEEEGFFKQLVSK